MDKCYLTYGLDGRFLLAQTQSAQARPRCRWRPGAPSEEIETRDSCTPVVLSSPTLLSCTSQPESPVPLAPCTTCGSRGASKEKKKCWFKVCCRECIPAWWGALVKRENLIRVLLNRAEGSVYGHILSFFLPSSEYQPVPISRTAISGSFFSTTSKKQN